MVRADVGHIEAQPATAGAVGSAAAGLLSLLLLWTRPSRPSWRAVLGGLMAFAILWLGVGLLGQLVWLTWFLIPRRLLLWPLGALLSLPWFLAAGETVRGARVWGRIGWWLAHSIVLVAAINEKLELVGDIPKGMQGPGIIMVVSGIIALAFLGFAGIVRI